MNADSGSEWTPPEPHRLHALRETLADQMLNPHEYLNQATAIAGGLGTIVPVPGAAGASARLLLAEERRRLQSARLYSVNDEMTEVAIRAGATMPVYTFRREDLPSPFGFAVFDKPIGQYDGASGTVSIVAVSWGPTMVGGDMSTHLWLTFWSVTHYEYFVELFRGQVHASYKEAREVVHQHRAELSWDNEVLAEFGESGVRVQGSDEPLDPADTTLANQLTLGWTQTIRAAWLMLKSQKLVDVEERPLPRTVRRRAERGGYESSPVRVVTLHKNIARRNSTEDGEGRGGYKVKVRTIVTGHVRWQPYPSRDTIEPIWIEAHPRGPADAPLSKGSTTVFRLDRPPGGRPPVGGK